MMMDPEDLERVIDVIEADLVAQAENVNLLRDQIQTMAQAHRELERRVAVMANKVTSWMAEQKIEERS